MLQLLKSFNRNPSNNDGAIPSRQYLYTETDVAKISEFNDRIADLQSCRGVNPEILATANLSGTVLRYRLSETAPSPILE